MFEQNDIVINFYRCKVYRFDRNNKQHCIDFFRCRFATFAEIEKFEALKKETASIKEIGVKRHENEIGLNLKIGRDTLARLHKIAKTLSTKNYETVFYEVLRSFLQNANYQEIKELRKKNEDLERKLKTVAEILK